MKPHQSNVSRYLPPPGVPALTGQQAPVIIRRVQQPVLKEMPLHMNDLPKLTPLHQRPHLQHRREEPAHIVHCENRRTPALHNGHYARGLLRRHPQRLLAHHMFAGGQCGERLLHMHFVRRRDVHHIHVRRREHRAIIIVPIDLGDAPLVGTGASGLRGTTDRRNLHAESLERLDVNRADETSADHAGAKLMQRDAHGRKRA